MAASADVELRLRLSDQASRGLKKAAQEAQKDTDRTASATERAAARGTAASMRGAGQQRAAFQRLAQAREQLGLRPERAIQREIQRTEAAYARLRNSGSLSWREQARAAEQARQRVAALTNEMGRLTARQKAAGAVGAARNIGAGVAGAAYAAQEPARKYVDYSLRLARMANTAFEERDTEGRVLGAKDLNEAVMRATREGGGSRDDAAAALDAMIASGAVNTGDAMKMLPQIMKAATASGASAEEMANIAIRSMQNFDISAEELPRIFNMAVAAGKAGGFELKDMSRWLPQQLASAKTSGMSGQADFAALAALNQAAAITAGTKDEAGNNVANLLGKINSRDTALDAERLGINLSKELQDARAKGVNSIDAFGGIVTKIMEKDPSYRKLQSRLATESDEDKKKTFERMAQIAQGSAIGNIVQDRQALMALMSFVNNQGYMEDVRKKVLANDVESGGAVDKDMEVIRRTVAFSGEQKNAAQENASFLAVENAAPLMNAWNNAMADLNTRFPKLAGSLDIAAKAAIGFAAAAGLSSMLGGGGGILRRAAGSVGAGLGRAASGLGRSAVAATAGISAAGIGKGALKMAGKGGLAAVGAVAGEYALGKAFGEESAAARYGGAALSGAGMGATVGSIIPGVGTAIGAAAGGAIGLIAQGLSDWFNSDDAPEIATQQQEQEQRPVEVDANLRIGLAPGLVLQSQNMAASAGNVRMSVGNIFADANS